MHSAALIPVGFACGGLAGGLLSAGLRAALLGACLSAGAVDAPEEVVPRELGPGVFAAGFSDRYGSANAGWVLLGDRVVLIGPPHPDLVAGLLEAAARSCGKPVREAILTSGRPGELAAARLLEGKGVALLSASDAQKISGEIDAFPLGGASGQASMAVFVRGAQVLFAGEACVNGPRAPLAGSDTARWIDFLRELRRRLPARVVVPGVGSVGGPEVLERLERYLVELRRQVSHRVAQGLPADEVRPGVRIEPEWLVWMPYDEPSSEDIDHVRAELTVPVAPFGGGGFPTGGGKPRALAIIGDRPHEPGHLEAGLRPAFDAAGVDVRFAVDPQALTAENLKAVQLLVILRDGHVWPDGAAKPPRIWMTPEQERAVVEFVESGGGFLALHNATGLYRDGGPYLKLLGGTYQGHGPLERFHVSVIDRDHPITRGVKDYEAADEQHTPAPDLGSVHLLLESRSAGGVKGHAGWVREAGKGRVAYLASGHTREALANPSYQVLLRNAMRWCLRRGE